MEKNFHRGLSAFDRTTFTATTGRKCRFELSVLLRMGIDGLLFILSVIDEGALLFLVVYFVSFQWNLSSISGSVRCRHVPWCRRYLGKFIWTSKSDKEKFIVVVFPVCCRTAEIFKQLNSILGTVMHFIFCLINVKCRSKETSIIQYEWN